MHTRSAKTNVTLTETSVNNTTVEIENKFRILKERAVLGNNLTHFYKRLSSSGSDSDNDGNVFQSKKKVLKSRKRTSKCKSQVAKKRKVLDTATHSQYFDQTSSPPKSSNTTINWDSTLKSIKKKDQQMNLVTCLSNTMEKIVKTDESEDDDDNWEEVEDIHCEEDEIKALTQETLDDKTEKKIVIPESIEITINNKELTKKCKTKSLEEILKRELDKTNRETQERIHKMHILSLIAHGIFLNRLASSRLLKGLALSILPSKFLGKSFKDINDFNDIKEFISWFKGCFTFDSSQKSDDLLRKRLKDIFMTKTAMTRGEISLLIVIFLRTLKVDTRIILAFNPISLKVTPAQKSKRPIKKHSLTKAQKASTTVFNKLSDSDFEESVPLQKVKSKKPLNRKVLSSDSDSDKVVSSNDTVVYWVELFLPNVNRWICFDYFSSILDNPIELASSIVPNIFPNLIYVVGFGTKQSIKSLACRYDVEWATKSRKKRVSDEWWNDLLDPWKSKVSEVPEDQEIIDGQLKLPLPVKVDDFKGHPLYRLRRHLLKYEVIYPETALPLGFIKTEPIFAREVIHLCHTRETWLKQARVVCIGEEPAKRVRAKLSLKRKLLQEKEPLVELYGRWQTAPYQPPVARDGIVPKNEHGNVELYKPCMMPIGCVHLDLPGLSRVAKKISIDIAPAMTGWEFHGGGWAHPVLQGWVVCREMVPVLRDAWAREEEEKAKRAAGVRSARALAGWRRLVKGLMIRARLHRMYDLEGDAVASRVSSIAHELALLRQKRIP